jgi:hypothetical protein
VFAVTGQLDQAVALDQRTLREYRARLGAAHPFAQVVAGNLAQSQRLLTESRPEADPADLAAQRDAIALDIPPY